MLIPHKLIGINLSTNTNLNWIMEAKITFKLKNLMGKAKGWINHTNRSPRKFEKGQVNNIWNYSITNETNFNQNFFVKTLLRHFIKISNFPSINDQFFLFIQILDRKTLLFIDIHGTNRGLNLMMNHIHGKI